MIARTFPGALAALTLALTLVSGAAPGDAAPIQQSSPELSVGVYATGGSANYCPAGLEPVSVDGTTSCGTPNREGTYDRAKQAPDQRGKGGAGGTCAPGIKGCY